MLTTVLDATPPSFSVDLAALAARREYLNLEKWLCLTGLRQSLRLENLRIKTEHQKKVLIPFFVLTLTLFFQ
jgi:hypothetical protein